MFVCVCDRSLIRCVLQGVIDIGTWGDATEHVGKFIHNNFKVCACDSGVWCAHALLLDCLSSCVVRSLVCLHVCRLFVSLFVSC